MATMAGRLRPVLLRAQGLSTDLNYEAVARKIGAKGNGDLPFSNAAILCEGQDDVAVVRLTTERREIVLDALSVAVADCGGVENLPDYATFCSQLGIPFLVVTDGDASKAAQNERVRNRVTRLLSQVGTDPLGSRFAFKEDLEAGLGMTSNLYGAIGPSAADV